MSAVNLQKNSGNATLATPTKQTATLWRFAPAATALSGSAIREILKVTEQPAVLSFAGGLPDRAAVPIEPTGARHA